MGKTATENLQLINQAYGDNFLLRSSEWFKQFKDGREDQDDPKKWVIFYLLKCRHNSKCP
jgi:hypothetical protein